MNDLSVPAGPNLDCGHPAVSPQDPFDVRAQPKFASLGSDRVRDGLPHLTRPALRVVEQVNQGRYHLALTTCGLLDQCVLDGGEKRQSLDTL